MHLESRHLAAGTINLRLGAVRRLAYEPSDCGLLSSDLAAGIRRLKGVKRSASDSAIGLRRNNLSGSDIPLANWNRSNSYSATSQSRRPSDTWAANSGSDVL
jgi:hypothetical protein